MLTLQSLRDHVTSGQDEFKRKMGKLLLLFSCFLQYLPIQQNKYCENTDLFPSWIKERVSQLWARYVSDAFRMCFECVSDVPHSKHIRIISSSLHSPFSSLSSGPWERR